MIYMNKNDLKYSVGISEYMDRAIAYILSADLDKFPIGKNAIEGENIYVNKMEYETVSENDGLFEAHDDYIDIHILLKGKEKIYVSHREHMKMVERKEAEDCIIYEGTAEAICVMDTSKVLIAFPKDVHKVKVNYDKSSIVTKLVFKVKTDKRGAEE